MVIAILRRRDAPPEFIQLFHRIWAEEGAALIPLLNTRWMIAAATTFGDHGTSTQQCLAGQGLSLLFDLIKLHESERRLSGQPNTKAFSGAPTTPDLAFDLAPYAAKTGDLDKNLLARLWRLCENDRTIRPLGFHMLRMVMTDKRTVFARLQQFKPRESILDDLQP